MPALLTLALALLYRQKIRHEKKAASLLSNDNNGENNNDNNGGDNINLNLNSSSTTTTAPAAAAAATTPPPQRSRLRDKVKALTQVAIMLQVKTGETADAMERVRNLVTWRAGDSTQTLMQVLIWALAATLIVPFKLLLPAAQLGFAFKFFIMDAIYINYPRMRRHDGMVHFWDQLPTDAQVNERSWEAVNMDFSSSSSSNSGSGNGSGEIGSNSTLSSGGSSLREGIVNMESSDTTILAAVAAGASYIRKGGEGGGGRGRRGGDGHYARAAHDVLCLLGVPVDEAVVETTSCLLLRPGNLLQTKKGRLYVTQGHVAFVKSSSPQHPSFVIPFHRLIAVNRAKPIALLPGKGFALELRARTDSGSGDTTTHIVGGLINRDEMYAILCRLAQLPCVFGGGGGGGS